MHPADYAAGEPVAVAGTDHDGVVGREFSHAVVEAAAALQHDEHLVVVVGVGRHAKACGQEGAVHEKAALAFHQLLATRSGFLRLLEELFHVG